MEQSDLLDPVIGTFPLPFTGIAQENSWMEPECVESKPLYFDTATWHNVLILMDKAAQRKDILRAPFKTPIKV